MKFNALRDFLLVAERGSLRAAARQLGSAQAAMSHSIQELEKELGVALFERRSTGVILTPIGAVFRKRAMSVSQELRKAREEVEQLRGDTHGNITVALSSVPHLALVPSALRPFRQRYPEVKIDIIDSVYPGVESRLLDGSVDFYAGPAPTEAASGLLVETLFDNTRVIVGRKGHPLAGAKSLTELTGAEWITTSITYNAEDELGPLFAQHGLPVPKMVMKCHSTLTFLVAMVYSDLLMMLPVQWTQSPLLNDKVEQIRVKEPLPAPAICLVARAGLPMTPAAAYFATMLRRGASHLKLE